MNILKHIEQKYNVSFPKLFKQMYAEDFLDWGELGRGWYEKNFHVLKKNPPFLLLTNQFEPIYLNEAEQVIEDMTDEHLIPGQVFIPFGHNGAGDQYVFQFDRQQGEDVPITIWPHDEDYATILARNIQDFMFRMVLEPLTHIDEYSHLITADGDHTNALNLLHTHGQYLTDRQVEILNEIYHRPVLTIEAEYATGEKYTYKQVITREELDEIFSDTIAFDDFNKEFKYLDY